MRSETGSGFGTILLEFSAPVVNPVLHVAHLDHAYFSFPAASGATLSLVSGNGDGVDGLEVSGLRIQDRNKNTTDSTPPTAAPPLSGDRAGYGSVRLLGTFSTLRFNIINSEAITSPGNFTLSTGEASAAPEPGTGLLCLSCLGYGFWLRRRTSTG